LNLPTGGHGRNLEFRVQNAEVGGSQGQRQTAADQTSPKRVEQLDILIT
jgi:hypothetical protein